MMPERSDRQRVVITGMGAVSPFGMGAQTLWRHLLAGQSGIRPLRHADRERLRVKIAAQVPADFDDNTGLSEEQRLLQDRCSQLAVVAAREAVQHAGLDFSCPTLARETAAIIGCGVGGELAQDQQSRRLYREDSQRVHPFTIVRLMVNAPASHISMDHGLRGPSYVVASACASANHALIQAAHAIRHGQAAVAISGGTEACLSYGSLRAWEAMRILAPDNCRPFHARRRGLVLAEGAAIFVLESLQHARARQAPILAEIAGGGMSADGSDIVQPDADGQALAMQRALQDAGLNASDIEHINAHGTGTLANDVTETRAIHQAFGAHAHQLSVTASKSMHGHALGAAGALELVGAIGALQHGVVAPTINLDEVDPDCDLDYVPEQAREQKIKALLSNSFAFGGLNAVLALTQAP